MAQENVQAEVQPTQLALPRHVAIIMDGNGRWANKKNLPRYMGHREGVKAVRRIVSACQKRGIEALTLFAFSSENWRRPKTEVGLLMDLFVHTLKKEVNRLDRNGVHIRFIGNLTAFDPKLRSLMDAAEQQTAHNHRLTLVIAVNYGGRWDLAETGGEQRISNFLLWQLAYTELYFTDLLWPDFTDAAFSEALQSFASRQRRFGQTGDQIEQSKRA
jgi:undecaprenyl diphosphate synthase